MPRKMIIILSLLAILLLAYFCIKTKSPVIEDDLEARSGADLVSEGMGWANVSADGRELLLTGSAPTEALRSQAGDIVKNIWGVRAIDNQLTVESESIAVAEPKNYDLVVTYDGVNVLLEGYVPDEATRSDIVEATKLRMGASNVIDKMTIEAGAPAGWGDSIKRAAIDHLSDYTNMTAHFHNTDLSITGYVASESMRDQLEQRSSQSLTNQYTLIDFNVKLEDVEPVVVHVAAIDCQNLFNNLLSNQKIYFEVSRARIKSESDTLLEKLAEVALKCPDTRIEIAGHTDSSGPRAMNQKLSEMRAQAVVKRLVEKNINSNRLVAIGYGEMKSIANNKTVEGRAENRRIEFNILGD
ncbi:MAG: OmpA family protein [Gammaproteobacteria bacterium]|nr:OmpA family protein [Gammaproteobacteria bacterium]